MPPTPVYLWAYFLPGKTDLGDLETTSAKKCNTTKFMFLYYFETSETEGPCVYFDRKHVVSD